MRQMKLFPAISQALPALFLVMSTRAYAQKVIQAQPGVPVIAETTWYYTNCTTSAGLGSYSVNIAPKHGSVSIANVSGPVPGCPAGSPSLPAVQAYYTWTDNSGRASGDSFELYYNLNGKTAAAVLDVSVILDCSATPSSPACTPPFQPPPVLPTPPEPTPAPVLPTPPCSVSNVVARSGATILSGDACTPPPTACTSTTVVHVPGAVGGDARRKIGVGEVVHLQSTNGQLQWNIQSGSGCLTSRQAGPALSDSCRSGNGAGSNSRSAFGTDVYYIAPFVADQAVITTSPSSDSSCTIPFTTVEPSGMQFYRYLLDSDYIQYGFDINAFGNFAMQLWLAAFLIPGDISFANINVTELDISAPFTAGLLHSSGLGPAIFSDGKNGWFVGCDKNIKAVPSHSISQWAFQDLQGGHRKSFSSVQTSMTFGADYNVFSVPLSYPSDDVVFVKGQLDALNDGGQFIPTPGHPGVLAEPRGNAVSIWNLPHDLAVFHLVNEYTTCVADVGSDTIDGFTFPYKTQTNSASVQKPSGGSR